MATENQADKFGHQGLLISAKLVSSIRQNQKTDKNDALAILQAATLPEVSFVSGKTSDQQQLQSIKRFRELAVKQRDATRKQMIALLMELNLKVPKSGALRSSIQRILEDAENSLSMAFREALGASLAQFEHQAYLVAHYDDCLADAIADHSDCKRLMQLEGVGIVNAINLFIALGCNSEESFDTGRSASACIGLTPVQYSSGGKAKLGSIGKHTKSIVLRSQLITGAMSVIQQVVKRSPRTRKEQWIQQLVERRGKKCAAVALANKTVRTAHAMLRDGTSYRAEPLVA